ARLGKPVNYDGTNIPANYDAGRSLSPEVVARWTELVASHSSAVVRTILDIGCGTGRFAAPPRSAVVGEIVQQATGLRRLRAYGIEHASTPVTETIDYFAFR